MNIELKDVLWYLGLGLFFFMMMRRGGCCGGHRKKEGKQENTNRKPDHRQLT